MSKTIRVYLVVAVGAVVGLFVGVKVLDNPLVGVLIAALALAGGLYLLRRESADEGDFFATPGDDAAEEPAIDTTPRASSSTATAEPLATWEPEGLTPWTPPESDSSSATLLDEEEELDVLDLEELEHIDEFVEAEAEAATLEEEVDTEPEIEIEIEEDEPELVEVAAEHDAHGSAIDEIEDVHSDDDIMKASHATELSVTAPAEAADNSELAKLLAKVQSRLAAYE